MFFKFREPLPFRELNETFNQLEKIFADTDSLFSKPNNSYSESDDEYLVEFSVPGHSKETVEVSIADSYVCCVAKPTDESSSLAKNHSVKFRLPSNIDESKIEATVKNGILTIAIPKSSKKLAKGSKIEVK